MKTHTATQIHFGHSPADNCVSCVCRQYQETKHLIRTCYKNYIHSNLKWKWRTFYLASVESQAPPCSLILFDWPLFDLDKKGMREPPRGFLWAWRHFRIFFLSLDSFGWVARLVHLKGQLCKVLHATFAWWWTGTLLIYTEMSFQPKWVSCCVGRRLCTIDIISVRYCPHGPNTVQSIS